MTKISTANVNPFVALPPSAFSLQVPQYANRKIAAIQIPAVVVGAAISVTVAGILAWYYSSWSKQETQEAVAECANQVFTVLDSSAKATKNIGANFKVPTKEELRENILKLFQSTKKNLKQTGTSVQSAPAMAKKLLSAGVDAIIGATPKPTAAYIPSTARTAASHAEVRFATHFSANVKIFATVWINKTTGEVSAKPQNETQWAKARFAKPHQINNGSAKPSDKTVYIETEPQVASGTPNPKGGGKGPKWDKIKETLIRLGNLAGAGFGIAVGGTFVDSWIQSNYDRAGEAWHPEVAKLKKARIPFSYLDDKGVTRKVSDVSTKEGQASAIRAVWAFTLAQVREQISANINNPAPLLAGFKKQADELHEKLADLAAELPTHDNSPTKQDQILDLMRSLKFDQVMVNVPQDSFLNNNIEGGIRLSKRTSKTAEAIVNKVNEAAIESIYTLGRVEIVPVIRQLAAIKKLIQESKLSPAPKFSVQLNDQILSLEMFTRRGASPAELTTMYDKAVKLRAAIMAIRVKEKSPDAQAMIDRYFLDPITLIVADLPLPPPQKSPGLSK
jgi:hypothetical protein